MRYFKVILVCLMPAIAIAQSKVFFNVTVGQYSMNDLKELQNGFQKDFNNTGTDVKPVATFPVSLQMEAGFLKGIEETLFVGGYLNYAFTKGRLHYSDYSGQVYIDQNVYRIVAGCMATKNVFNSFSFYGKLGFNYSKLKMDFGSEIYGVGTDHEYINFYSLGMNIEPGISWNYKISKIALVVNAGYELNVQGKTFLENQSDAYLQDSNGDEVNINWSGARMGIGVTYQFQ